jgi:hypothetical protein
MGSTSVKRKKGREGGRERKKEERKERERKKERRKKERKKKERKKERKKEKEMCIFSKRVLVREVTNTVGQLSLHILKNKNENQMRPKELCYISAFRSNHPSLYSLF